MSASDTRRLTSPPAVVMLVISVAAVAFGTIGLIGGTAQLAESNAAVEEFLREYFPDVELDPGSGRGFALFTQIAMVLAGLTAALGSIQLLRERSRTLSFVAALLMFTPFLWPCCCPLPAGIGIWAIVILMRDDVRAAMGARPPVTPPAFEVPPPPPPEQPGQPGPPPSEPEDTDAGWGSDS